MYIYDLTSHQISHAKLRYFTRYHHKMKAKANPHTDANLLFCILQKYFANKSDIF